MHDMSTHGDFALTIRPRRIWIWGSTASTATSSPQRRVPAMGEVVDGVVRIATRGSCTTLYSTGLRSMRDNVWRAVTLRASKQQELGLMECRGRWGSRALVTRDVSPGAAVPPQALGEGERVSRRVRMRAARQRAWIDHSC